MGTDELVVCLVGIFLTITLWGRWYRRGLGAFAPQASGLGRAILLGAPVGSVAALSVAIARWSAPEVRGNYIYIGLFAAAGAVAMALASIWLALLGIDPLDDGIVKGNPAMPAAAAGTWIAVGIVNAGSNIGAGDTIYTTLIPVAIGLTELGAFSFALAWLSGWPERIAIERSRGSGMAFGVAMIAASAPIARAAAGNWVSLQATVRDFEAPLLWLAVIALACGAVGRFLRLA